MVPQKRRLHVLLAAGRASSVVVHGRGGLFAGKTAPDDFEPVDPNIWLDRRDAAKVETLREHSIKLANYSAVLTFLWVEGGPPAGKANDLLEELDPDAFTLDRKRWPR